MTAIKTPASLLAKPRSKAALDVAFAGATAPVLTVDAVERIARSELGVSPALLTPSQVAELLNVSERTLERWRQTDDGPAYARLSRKTIRYSRVEIDQFMDRCRAQNTAA